ncbi:hypothetical protein [Faecalibacterium sp. An58]|uniref:hypothetical protein n=1 Tax=Faecalibacterium sp. An58 TaxID=1965648 RepID=UPI001182188D|nr:hypothetical protein [Faecalibacterium sp. An58]
MKLKKIASLALAGIMAVSMLAGCKDGGNGTNNGGASSDNSNTNSGYSAYVLNMSNAGDSKSIVAADDAKLNAAVENFVKNKPVNFSNMSNVRNLKLLSDVTGKNNADVKVWLAQAARDMSGATAVATGNGWDTVLGVNENKDKDKTAYCIYYISAAMNDDVIDNLVANKIDQIAGVINGSFNPDKEDSYSFTVSATKEYWQVGKDANADDDGVVIGIAVNFEYNKAEY